MSSPSPAAAVENARDLGIFRVPAQSKLWRDPTVLEQSWSAPQLVGRDEILTYQGREALSGLTAGGRVAVSVTGPRGAGTSAVAKHLVRIARLRLTRTGAKGEPLQVRVEVSECRSPAALATAIFRSIDPTFEGRGASAEYLCLLLHRRLRTMGRPTILWLDQVRSAGELGRVARCLACPEQLLPEGTAGLPTMLLVTSGDEELVSEEVPSVRARLAPLQGRELVSAIMLRASLAFQAPPSMEAVVSIADLALAQGWGLSMVGELLLEAGKRAEARGGRWLEVEDVALPSLLPRARQRSAGFDAVLLEVLRNAKGALSVGALRSQAVEHCKAAGIRSPTGAFLWRHLVGLEKSGVVSREVRVGGSGGSRTMVSLTGRP